MEKTIKNVKKVSTKNVEKTNATLNVKAKKIAKTVNKLENESDPFPITLKKTEVKKVLDMYTGTKNFPKTSVNEITKILNVEKKQVIRVLHKHGVKQYRESSLR